MENNQIYQKLSLIGISLLIASMALRSFIPIEFEGLLVGIAFGWIAATATLRYMIMKNEAKQLKKKSVRMLTSLQKLAK